MTDLLLRRGPSGPLVSLSDTLSPPGTVLGRSLEDIGQGFAVPLVGSELGGIVRFDGVYELELPAGSHDNVAIPDGVRNVDITPVGGDVTITGLLVSGRGNTGSPGLNITLRGTDGIITFANGSTSSTLGNRISGTSNIAFQLTEPGDCVCLARIEGGTGRWQTVARAIRPLAVQPQAIATPGVIVYGRRGFSATGAAADDILIGASPSAYNMVAYEILLQISTAVGATTAQLRSDLGGGGLALSSAMSMAATGTVRNNDVTITPVPTGTLFYLRRSNGNTAGTVIIFFRALD
jgi:hypothetical protein